MKFRVSSTCSPQNVHTYKPTYFGTSILLNFFWSQRGRRGSISAPRVVITFPSAFQSIIISSCTLKLPLSSSSFPLMSNTLRYPILHPSAPWKQTNQQNKTKNKDLHLDPKSFSHYYCISLLVFMIEFPQRVFFFPHLSFFSPSSLDFCPTT